MHIIEMQSNVRFEQVSFIQNLQISAPNVTDIDSTLSVTDEAQSSIAFSFADNATS